MNVQDGVLEVYQAGKLTVVGFGGHDILDGIHLAECREGISKLLEEHECEVFAFDLTGVKLVPSGLLGLLASLRQQNNVEVHLYNPCEDIEEVLEITRLNEVMTIHQVDI